MKTYKNLYNKYISKENVKLAIINAVKKKKKKDKKTVVLNINNKKRRVTLKEISENPDKYVEVFREYALNYHGEEHHYVEIYDGVSHKLRRIHDARQMISYLGKLKSTDVYDYYTRYIKSLVDFGNLKKKISRYDVERRLKAV